MAAFASMIVDALVLLSFDLEGVALYAVVVGALGLIYFCGARISDKIINRGIGK